MRNFIHTASRKLRELWRGNLPDDLLRARNRFTIYATALVLVVLALALMVTRVIIIQEARHADDDVMSQVMYQTVQLPEGAVRKEIPEAPSFYTQDGFVVEMATYMHYGVYASRTPFRVLIYPDGTYMPLTDSSVLMHGAQEFASALMADGAESDWFEQDAADWVGGSGVIYRDRRWGYLWQKLNEDQVKALEAGGTLLFDGGLDVSGKPGAYLFTVLDKSYTAALELSSARTFGIAWLICVLPALVACHVLARFAMRPAALMWEQQRRFVLDASHELKTPLASLSADLDALVANGGETVASQERWTGCMRADIDILASLAYRLLELARADAGAPAASAAAAATCDPACVAKDVLGRFEARAAARGLTCSFEAEPVPSVAVASSALSEVLAALVENAVTYADEGGCASVSVTALSGSKVAVTVTNSGPGISNEDLPHVFDRFFRADAARTQDEDGRPAGFGLGLSIAEARARGFGAHILASSEPGVRTAFTLVIPAAC